MADYDYYIVNRGGDYIITVAAGVIYKASTNAIDSALREKIKNAEDKAKNANKYYGAIDYPANMSDSGIMKSYERFLAGKR